MSLADRVRKLRAEGRLQAGEPEEEVARPRSLAERVHTLRQGKSVHDDSGAKPTARKRGTLEKITRVLTMGERFTAGGAKRTGVLSDKQVSALEIIGKMVTRPREFAKGGMEAVRGDYDWQQATQEIAPKGTSGLGKAAAGLVRGIAYDPLTYVPLSWPGKILKHGFKAIPAAKKAAEAVKAIRPIAALARGRGAQTVVAETEREARRIVSAAEPGAVRLAERAHGKEAVTTYVQRGAEDAMQEVYGTRGAQAVAEVKNARQVAKQKGALAKKLTATAKAHTDRAAEIRAKGVKGVPLRGLGKAEGRAGVAETQVTAAERAERLARQKAAALQPIPTRPLAGLIGAEQRALGKAGTEATARAGTLERPFTTGTARIGLPEWMVPEELGKISTASEAKRAATRLTRLQEGLQKAQQRAIRLEGSAGARAAQKRLMQASRQVEKAQKTVFRLEQKVAEEQSRAVGNVDRLAAAEETRAVKATTRAVQAQEQSDLAISRAQQLGIRQAQLMARNNPKKALQAVEAFAQRNAIPEAHASARGYIDASIDRLRRSTTFGNEYADEVQGFFDDLQARAVQRGQEQAQFGVRTAEDMERWGPYHVRRFYEKYVTPDAEIERIRGMDPDLAAHLERMSQRARAFAGGQGIPSSALKHRELLPRPVRTKLGKLPLSWRVLLGERTHAIATSEGYRLQQYAAKWGRQTLKGMGEKQARHWMEVPVTDRWGALKDTPYIPKWLGAHLGLLGQGSGWEHKAARLASWALTARPGEATGWYARQVMGSWKFLHTAGNLPTAFRNMVTNGALTYLIGKVPVTDLPRYWGEGWLAALRRTPEFEAALKLHPGFSSTWTKSELNFVRGAVAGAKNWTESLPIILKQLAKSPGGFEHAMSRFYELSEQAAKMTVYLYHTRNGMAPVRAAELAMKAIFDYGDVSRVVNWLRRYGVAPFITYPVKAAKGLIPAAVTDTGRFATVAKAIKAPGYAMDDVGDMEVERQYMTPEQRGSLMRLPIKTKEGETRYAEVGYYLPWGPWQEGVGFSWLDTMPVARVIEDIARNKSSFTDRPIYNPSLPGDKWPSIAIYLKDFLGPRWLVSGIGKVARAAAGQARGRAFAKPAAADWRWEAAQQFGGLRTQGVRPEQLRGFRALELRGHMKDLRSAVAKAARKEKTGELTPEELADVRRRALEGMRRWRAQTLGR